MAKSHPLAWLALVPFSGAPAAVVNYFVYTVIALGALAAVATGRMASTTAFMLLVGGAVVTMAVNAAVYCMYVGSCTRTTFALVALAQIALLATLLQSTR